MTRQACAEKAAAEADAARAKRRDAVNRWVVPAAALAISVLGAAVSVTSSTRQAADIAELSTSGQVASARASSAAVLRGDPGQVCEPDGTARAGTDRVPTLRCANAALIGAGVVPVPDPGPGANAYQLSVSTARALARLDDTLTGRGAQPGVRTPDAGRFPGRPTR